MVHLLKNFFSYWSDKFFSFSWKLCCLSILFILFFFYFEQAVNDFAFVFAHIIHPVAMCLIHWSKFLLLWPLQSLSTSAFTSSGVFHVYPCQWLFPLSGSLQEFCFIIFVWHFYIYKIIHWILNNIFVHVCSVSPTKLMSPLRSCSWLVWIPSLPTNFKLQCT